MNLVLFSDLHIKDRDDPIYRDFLRALNSLEKPDYIILLGDIFNFLYGNADWAVQHYRELFNTLKQLHERGTKIYYTFGNHDFNFSFHTVDYIHIDNSFIIDIAGKKFLALHGDGIGEKDSVYKLLKSILRSRFFFFIYKIFPRVFIYRVANAFAFISRLLSKRKSKAKVKSFYRARARALAKAHNVDVVFMGHSHIYDHVKTKYFEYYNVGEFKKNSYKLIEI